MALLVTTGRGGARHHRKRQSDSLTVADVGAVLAATASARHLGLSFNRMTTIHWEAAGVTDDLAATRRVLKRLGDCLRARGEPFAYVWVRENGDDKGAHVHIYWRGPVEFPDLRSRLGSWIRAVGGKRRKGVFHTRPVGLTLAHANSGGRTYDLELDDALDYALKGAGPEARAAYGIRRDEPGRPMTGKRWGRSRNLGGSDFSLTVKEQSKRIETPQPVLR